MSGPAAGDAARAAWQVERAAPADEPALVELALAAGAVDWSEAALRAELARDDVRSWLVRCPTEPAGLLITRRVIDEMHVMSVAVAERLRRQGIGRALLEAAIRHARADRLTALLLELRASNRPARALYERLGFVVVGRRPRYYPGGEDAILMTLTLCAAGETK